MKVLLPNILSVLLVLASIGEAGANNEPCGSPGEPLCKSPNQFFVDESKLPFNPLPGASAQWGVHKGAGYRIEVPEDWNGDLVMWAHGFAGTSAELEVQNIPIREHLISNGYAWAASSYSKNNYEIQAGVLDTKALATRFNGLVGKPARVFLMGFSMGGHITGVSIEQFPEFYAGAIPMCGVMGDNELFSYFINYNLAAVALTAVDASYPFNPATFPTDTAPQIFDALGGVDPFTGYPLNPSAAGLALKGVLENLSGGERAIYDDGFLFWEFIRFLSGVANTDGSTIGPVTGRVIDNVDTVFQIDSDPALSPEEIDLNALVQRVMQEPQGRHPNGLAAIPVISGDLPVPVISMHTLGDLFVPWAMEEQYTARVAAHGKSNMLATRAIRAVGHCEFVPEEVAEAFDDLVEWVDTGFKAQGDSLDPLVKAAPDYGCQFTRVDRSSSLPFLPDLPACP